MKSAKAAEATLAGYARDEAIDQVLYALLGGIVIVTLLSWLHSRRRNKKLRGQNGSK